MYWRRGETCVLNGSGRASFTYSIKSRLMRSNKYHMVPDLTELSSLKGHSKIHQSTWIWYVYSHNCIWCSLLLPFFHMGTMLMELKYEDEFSCNRAKCLIAAWNSITDILGLTLGQTTRCLCNISLVIKTLNFLNEICAWWNTLHEQICNSLCVFIRVLAAWSHANILWKPAILLFSRGWIIEDKFN